MFEKEKQKEILLPDIIMNKEGLYEGNLCKYTYNLFFTFHNVDSPGHNARHMLDVTWKSYQGGKFHRLAPRAFRNLLIAALYHDANHPSQINGLDANAVQRAIETLRRDILDEDREHLDDIILLIIATEFPHRPESFMGPPTVAQRIIRDADISQALSSAWIQQILFGLSQEAKIPVKQMLFQQVGFINTVMIFTSEWGKKELEPLKASKLAEVHQWIEILGLKEEYKNYIGI